jgi:P27 family predicted phage terminase small subunit
MWPTPDDLKEAGKALWEEQGSLLTKARVLTDLDKPTFLLLCKCLDVVTQADATLSEEGLTISNRDGKRAHPLFCITKMVADGT